MPPQPRGDEELPPHEEQVAYRQRKRREQRRGDAGVRGDHECDHAEDESAQLAEGDEPARHGAVRTVLRVVFGVLELVEKTKQEE